MRKKLDEKIETCIGLAIQYIFCIAILAIKNVLKLPCNGLMQAKYTNKKIDITISILAFTPPIIAIYLLNTSTITSIIIYIITVLSLRGLVFSIEKYYFLTELKHCSIVSNNHKYPRLKAVKYEGLSKIFVLNLSVPTSKFIMSVSKLSNSLNTNIINLSVIETSFTKLSFYKRTKKRLEIETNKKLNIPQEYLKQERFMSVFKELNLDVKVKDYEDTEFQTTMYLDTDVFYTKMQSFIPEFRHRLKVDNLELLTDIDHDYKLIIKKRIEKIRTFLETWDTLQEEIKTKTIPILIGTNTNNGQSTLLDLTKDVVHGIVAGESGGGKSVLLHNICSSIVLADRPNVQCVFCDPKKNELKLYRALRNVKYYNDDIGIVKAVEDCVIEMDRRNNLFEPYDTICDIHDWNNNNKSNQLDYIVLIIDEIADFMLKNDKDIGNRFKDALTRLLQLARSTGFIIFLSTQNPIKDVITSNMKANIATRCGFATTDKVKSRTILDNNMCSAIDEKGKFIFQNKKQNIIHKSFFISENEKIEIINRLKQGIENQLEKVENISKELVNINDLDSQSTQDTQVENQNSQPEIKTINNLYNFYIMVQQNGELPNRSEIMNKTQLTEWQLRQFNDELKSKGKLRTKGNKMLVVSDELSIKRNQGG